MPNRQSNQRGGDATKETRDTLKPEILQVLLDNSQCDMVVYKAMLERFELEIQYIQTTDETMRSRLRLPPVQTLLPHRIRSCSCI